MEYSRTSSVFLKNIRSERRSVNKYILQYIIIMIYYYNNILYFEILIYYIIIIIYRNNNVTTGLFTSTNILCTVN